jgi:curli biogenesis system outer membrane secretion channel CsgG
MNNMTRSFWRPVRFALLVAGMVGTGPLMAATASVALSTAQSPPTAAVAEKPRLAIRAIAATPAVTAQAKVDGTDNALMQIEQGADVQLLSALEATRRFEIVARADLPSIIKEQDLTQSGNVNVLDPQAARAFQLAGARYVATLTISNYQEVVERTDLLNQFGTSKAERRTINLQAVLKIFDSTTGSLFRSTQVTLSESAVNEIMPGVEQKGVKTNVVLGAVAKKLASDVANAIADSLAPARVIGYTLGQITFNRSAESGVSTGQIYEVFVPGSAMIDPDTGEQLGAEEVHVGWARVTDAGTRFSTAQAIEDRGIDRGAMLRLRTQGLPAGVDPNAKATGSSASAPGAASTSASPSTPASVPAASAPATNPAATNAPATTDPAAIAPAASAPIRMAIFVKQRPVSVAPEKVSVFEDLVSADSTGPGVQIIRREDLVNAVNRLAPAGPNAGTDLLGSEAVDRILSNQTSAVQLAAQMQADVILTASITALQRFKRRLDDPSTGTHTDVDQWTLVTTYGLIDGVTGASLAAGTVQSDYAKRDTPELKVEVDAIDVLLRDAASRIGAAVRATVADTRTRLAATPAADVMVKFSAVLADLSIPDVRTNEAGEYVVGANNYNLQPMNVLVKVDGVAMGAAPGAFPLRPGLHRARFERPGLEPVEMMVNAREGLEISVPLQFTPEGRANWQRDAVFFNDLKNGAVMRDAELIKVRAVADFLRQSNIRLDTTNVQNLNLGGQSIWWQLLQ